MKKTIYLALGLMALLASPGCKEEDPDLGKAPTAADAVFTYIPSVDNPNIINFEAKNKTLIAKWDFGNGTTGEGSTAQASYPNKGTYTVKLTVFNSGGSASSTQDIVIGQDDPTLLSDPLYTFLTGGNTGKGYKTWVLDSTRDGHMGVGPNPSGTAGDYPEWWSAKALDKTNVGLYDDHFVFRLKGFGFDQITNGDVYINNLQAGNFPGSVLTPKADYWAPFGNQMNETWTLTMGKDTTITVSGKSFIGYYAGTQTYKVVRMSENELFLRYVDGGNNGLAWYLRLVPEDYPVNGGGGGGNPTFSLPINFESVEPEFTVFGNSTYTIVDNANKGGINTSNRVLETVHGSETWAGLFVNLKNKLDFSGSAKTISVKVFAPATGVMRIKLENSANTAEFIEKDVNVSSANQWVEVSIDFSDAAAGKFDRLVLFPGWDVANAGTFYLDDIAQK